MDKRKISILLPTAYRPRQLACCLQSIQDTCYRLNVTVMASPVVDDIESRAALHGYNARQTLRSTEEYQRGSVYAWNECLRAAPDADVYVLGADDLLFYERALSFALDALDEMGGTGLVGLNDLCSDGRVYAAHWLASRDFLIQHLGGVMYPPMYRSWWCDREITAIAQAVGLHRFAKSAVVEHLHYTFNKSPLDRTYAEARENYAADQVLFETRSQHGYPITWQPIIQ
jgi:hypothetical protein